MRALFVCLPCIVLLTPHTVRAEEAAAQNPGLSGARANDDHPIQSESASPEPEPTGTGVADDTNIDRAWLTPTAMTQPAGSWTFNDYELLVVGLTYGVTDSFQISGTTLLPIVSDMPLVLFLGVKAQLLDSGPLRLAAVGTFVSARNGTESGAGVLGGGVLSLCLDRECASLLSAGAYTAFGEGSNSSTWPLLFHGSAVLRASKHIKLVVEADSAAVVGGGTSEVADGFLFGYGIRFYSGMISGDVGFLKPITNGNSDLLLGIPWLNFTYRGT